MGLFSSLEGASWLKSSTDSSSSFNHPSPMQCAVLYHTSLHWYLIDLKFSGWNCCGQYTMVRIFPRSYHPASMSCCGFMTSRNKQKHRYHNRVIAILLSVVRRSEITKGMIRQLGAAGCIEGVGYNGLLSNHIGLFASCRASSTHSP